jgi:hypothetical protein
MTELAEAVASLVGPYLPVLLARGETLLEEAEIAIAPDLRKRVQAVWEKLHPSVSASPSADSAARLVAERPEDARARAAFELHIEGLLRGDSALADEMRELLASGDDEDAVPLADAIAGVRTAAINAGCDERVVRIAEADLATLLDEANSDSPHRSVVESRLRALAALADNQAATEQSRLLAQSVARLATVVRRAIGS